MLKNFKILGKQILIESPNGKNTIQHSKVLKTGQIFNHIKKGDIVYYKKKLITKITIQNNKYHILKEEDIIGRQLRQKQRHTKMVLCILLFIFLSLSTKTIEVNTFVYDENLPKMTAKGKPIYNVAIFNGNGVLNDQINAFINCINEWEDINYRLINRQEIIDDRLSDFDMIILAGGFASVESKTLGSEGKEKILKYVLNGGGFLGVCAGAYMALSSVPFAIPLINAQTVSKNWNRGFSMINVELTDSGKQLFGDIENIVIGYNNGPIIENYGDLHTRSFETLAYLRNGVGINEYEAKLMINTPAIARALNGDGRVVIMNVHPEKIDKYHYFVQEIIYWLSKKE